MAEVVAEMQERLLPEYEQLKKYDVCTDEQIRDCIRQRGSYMSRITQNKKSICDYGDFIIFEKKIHKWVTEKEKLHGTQMAGLKASIAKRIIRLYRDGLRMFPHEERFWQNYLQFSKKSVPHEVSAIYEKMLTFHGDKTSIWCDAALWAYEYSLNMEKVKEIFFRGLQRHPESESINKTFFDILLMEAAKLSPEKNVAMGTKSEQNLGLERVEIIYHNSKTKICKVNYFLGLLERCEEAAFIDMTVSLQKTILDDLMLKFPRDECLWDVLAQRELRGFNMADLKNIHNPETAEHRNKVKALLETEADDVTAPEECEDTKIIPSIWRKRTLKRRIELCCSVYQMAVRTLQTRQMWTLYINAMLKLNQDMSTQRVLKRKSLAIAYKEGHESGLMSVEHYCSFVGMFLESSDGIELAESVLSEAVKNHKSLQLYDLWVSMYIMQNNEPQVYEKFRKADSELGDKSFPIWRLTLQFYKTRYDDCFKRLQKLYKEACQKKSPEFGVFRAEYLEFYLLNSSIQKTRIEYDELCQYPPPCLELHQKMALLESNMCVKSKSDVHRWRLCHENATYYFGKTHSEIWIDYIKFERDHGDLKLMLPLYQRAKDTLEAKLVDNFISEYNLLATMI